MNSGYQLSQHLGPKQVLRWCLAVLVGAFIGIAAGHSLVGSVSGSVSVVDGNSMAPTFQSGDRIFTAPLPAASLERGDIVVVDDGQKEYAIKRLVGLPGETVQLWRGYVFIDRKMLREPYLPKYTFTFPDQQTETYTFRLEPGQYFVLGDNRVCSVDSRLYGPVERKQIKGCVPQSAGCVRARFDAYTLPAQGKRTIRACGVGEWASQP